MESTQFFIYAGAFIIALILYYSITQWAHQIHKRNRYLQAQINLLSKIAEKQGVSIAEINEIIEGTEKKHNPLA